MVHRNEEKLVLKKKVWITEEEYKTLRAEKKKQKISMAKIVCNLILEKYGRSKTTPFKPTTKEETA